MSFASFLDYVFGDRTRVEQPRAAGEGVYTAVCERCLNPFTYKLRRSGLQRDSIEYEPMRARLKIEAGVPNPVFCDPCFIDTINQSTPAPMTDAMPGSAMPLVMRNG